MIVAKLFWYLCVPKTKSTFQARIKPEVLSDLGPNPAQTRPEKVEKLTTLDVSDQHDYG